MHRPIGEKLTLKSATLLKLGRLIRPKGSCSYHMCKNILTIDNSIVPTEVEVGVLIIDILR